MTATQTGSAFDALTYEAPFLIENFYRTISPRPRRGEALFTEFKRYVVLACSDDRSDWQMYSLRVDEVWHQFVLFTWDKLFANIFGSNIHHNPSNAPKHNPANVSELTAITVAKTVTSFEDFKSLSRAVWRASFRTFGMMRRASRHNGA